MPVTDWKIKETRETELRINHNAPAPFQWHVILREATKYFKYSESNSLATALWQHIEAERLEEAKELLDAMLRENA